MDSDLAKTIKQLYDEQVANDRRSIVIRQTTEAEGTSQSGTAGLLIPLDGMLIGVAEMKFKLVFNDGFAVGENSSAGTPSTTVIGNGANTYPTLQSWKNAFPVGSVVLADNAYGAQCWDYAAGFWKAQTGRTLSTGVLANGQPTGMVKHSYDWANVRAYNMGSEFDNVTSWNNVQPGDWLFFNNGTYGHVAMAVSSPNSSGQITVWDQNTTGIPYPAGGAAIAERTITSANFIGALRYKAWH